MADAATHAQMQNRTPDEPSERKTQAEMLQDACGDLSLIRDTQDRVFAVVETNGHSEIHRVNSKGFRHFAGHRVWQKFKKFVSAQSLQDFVDSINARGLFGEKSAQHEMQVRMAYKDGEIFIDLCDDDWRVATITAGKIAVIESDEAHRASVFFRRAKGMSKLPQPSHNGGLEPLYNLIGLDDEQRILFIAWLLSCFRSDIPLPILILSGEQGSGKSTLSRIAKSLIDPNDVPLRSAPRDERELAISSQNSWLIAFDNLSFVSENLSDVLCKISTGGGFATRTLYSDDEEMLFSFRRPILINSIADVAARPDLLDRAVVLHLPEIKHRKTETKFWQDFEAARPRILRGLFELVQKGLRDSKNVSDADLPRMADFFKFAYAALGENFKTAYQRNREEINVFAIEANPAAEFVTRLMQSTNIFEDTASALLERAHAIMGMHGAHKQFPKTAHGLSGALKRIVPAMRRAGISIEFKRDSKSRKIHIEKIEN